MVTAVSDIRTVPIGEDLTKEDLRCAVLRGMETMFRVDKKLATGATFASGEWAVLNSGGEAARPSATPVAHSYLVFSGTDRFDAKATGQVTLVMSHPVVVKSSQFDGTQTYAVGDYLTVKDLGGGEAVVTKQGGVEPKLARVLEVGASGTYLTYETLGGV